jgi:hypothetical protein
MERIVTFCGIFVLVIAFVGLYLFADYIIERIRK